MNSAEMKFYSQKLPCEKCKTKKIYVLKIDYWNDHKHC